MKQKFLVFLLITTLLTSVIYIPKVLASAPSAGGNTTVVNPANDGAVSITEDAVQPETPNIRLIVPVLSDPGGGTPNSIRIISVTGGTLWDSVGGVITLGSSGTILSLAASKVDFRFRPDAGRDTNASFSYVVVDPHSSSVNSAASTATIPITAVNDIPVLQTSSGATGLGLAATYYTNSWDLTGSVYRRIDTSINFSNNFGVPGLNAENFSVRWSGQVKAPVTGSFVFSTASDDGVRLWIDNVLVIDNWTLHGETVDTAQAVSFTADSMHDIRMEFYERGGGEVARLRWAYPGQGTTVIPQTYLFPAITRPTLSFVNGSAAVVIDDAVTVSDVDSANIASATVEISANYQAAEDTLQFTNQNGITGVFSNGTLTLTGSSSVANYQTALRSVKYFNNDSTPTTSTRTIEFTVNDGTDESNSTYRDISFSGVNNPPVITEGTSVSVTMDEDSSPTAFSLTLNATDADFHSITWSVSSQASHGTASVSGTGDSKAISYVPTADYFGSDSFVVQTTDGIGTDTITVNVTINDRTPPIINSVAVSSITSTGASITWNTNENSSTKVSYGVTPSYGIDTSETDTSPRVSAHTKNLTGLLPCTKYYYYATSRDSGANSVISSGGTFITGGCEADTVPSTTTTSNIPASMGGTSSLTSGNSGITVDAPANFTDDASSVVIQVKAIDSTDVLEATGRPNELPREIGGIVFDVKAIINNTTVLDSFDAPVTIIYEYSDDDISGISESSLWLYHYHNNAWEALEDCAVDSDNNVVTCTTESFSIFGLFGKSLGTATQNTGVATAGCMDPQALNYGYATYHRPELCQYKLLGVQKDEEVVQAPNTNIFTQDLKTGSISNEVLQLQKYLNACGFVVATSGPGSLGQETNKFGAATRQALMKFQTAKGIKPVNGLVGPLTRSYLNADSCLMVEPDIEPVPEVKDVRDLTVGMTGLDVQQLQTLLIEQNTGSKALELKRVTATGLFSIYTKNALSEYQAKYNISPSVGYFGIKTRQQMKAAGLSGLWW